MKDLTLQARINRLVDNEMTESEKTNLLQELDQHETGWKSCALTMLEAAEVKRALSGLFAAGPAVVTRPTDGRSRLRLLAPMAAVCIAGLAFVLGRSSVGLANTDQIEVAVNAEGQSDAVEQKERFHNAQDVRDDIEIEVVGFAQMLQATGVGRRIPVLSGNFTEEELFQLTSIPDDVKRRARNRGLELQRVPRVMTVQLADGKKLAVPMDAVGLRQAKAEVL